MSDNYIVLVPEDPRFVPDEERQRQAKDRLAEIAPYAEEIEAKISSNIQFFDCGENFQYVFCPACDSTQRRLVARPDGRGLCGRKMGRWS
jgi:hypothetical protein